MEVQEIKEQLKSIFRQVINNDKWITIHPNGEDGKGRHLLLKDGESPKEAMKRQWSVDVEKKEDKKPSIAKEKLIEIDKNAEDKITDKDKWLEFTKEKAEILGDKIILGSSKILKKEDLEKMDDIKIQKLKKLYEKHNLFENTSSHSQKEDKSDTKDGEEDFEKGTKSTKKDEDRHQKVRDLEDKAYKEFKTMYDNYIDKDSMEGWGGIPASRFDKAKEQFNKKYKDAFDKLESDRFVSFEDFAKRENKQSDSKGESKSTKYFSKFSDIQNLVGAIKPGEEYFESKVRTAEKRLKDKLEAWEKDYEKETKPAVKQMKKRNIEVVKDELEQLNKLKSITNDKERDMALLEDLKKLITKVENDKGEEDMEIENEKVDKRKLIDEVAGIMKSAGCDDEVIRTAIGKMEKMSYDDSEKSADNECEDKEDVKNCGKKVKNEDEEDKKEVEEIEEDVKEDVENRGKKNVKNSKTDYFAKLNEIYNSAGNALEKCEYVSRADREKAAEDYFAR